MFLVDSHCHLDLLDLNLFDNRLENVIESANRNDVRHFLCVSVTLNDFPKMLTKIAPFACVSASVGLHPNEVVDTEPTAAELAALAAPEKIIAIGETGLDYYRSNGDLRWQQARFREHIRAAKAVNKPLIIHSRDAKADTLWLLEEENAQAIGGVMHCFTEDLDMAEAAMALGFYISFSGIVTFANAKTIQHVARHMPLERMLIETDSPWLAPIPHRGKPNHPGFVRHVAEFIAQLRGITLEEVAQHTTRNFCELFNVTLDI